MADPTNPAFEEHLAALRRALKRARDERGACPPWDELRADLLPGGKSRPGRGERLTHREMCPYCSEQVETWMKSFDHTADVLGAVEKGIVTGLAGGARGIVKRIAQRKEHAPEERLDEAASPPSFDPAVEPVPAPPPGPPTAAPTALPGPAPQPTYMATIYTPPQERPSMMVPPATASAPRAGQAGAPAAAPDRILVVEMADRRTPPEAVFLCAAVLEAEVAMVDDVRELANDPDLALVCGIVLGGVRPAAEWPTAVRDAKKLAPGRPVVLLSTVGATPTAGARRALGEALIGEDEPAERLLLALDRKLR